LDGRDENRAYPWPARASRRAPIDRARSRRIDRLNKSAPISVSHHRAVVVETKNGTGFVSKSEVRPQDDRARVVVGGGGVNNEDPPVAERGEGVSYLNNLPRVRARGKSIRGVIRRP